MRTNPAIERTAQHHWASYELEEPAATASHAGAARGLARVEPPGGRGLDPTRGLALDPATAETQRWGAVPPRDALHARATCSRARTTGSAKAASAGAPSASITR